MSLTTTADGSPRLPLFLLVPVFAFIALVAWAFASPVGASPDDDFHMISIWCANDDRADLCRPGPDAGHREVPAPLTQSECFAFNPGKSAACQGLIWENSDVWVTTDRGNFTGLYPTVYYSVTNLFASPDLQTSVLVIRVVNAFLFVALSSLLWWLVPTSRRPIIPAMWLLTMVPLGSFIIASVNPSSWALTGVGLSWLAMLAFLEAEWGPRKWGLGAFVVLTFTMAAGSRSDAAIYAVIGFGLAAVLGARRERAYLWSLLLPVVLAVIALVSFFSTSQSSVASSGLGSGPLTTVKDLLALGVDNLINVPALWVGAFGATGLGWLDTSMPAIVWVATLVVFAGVVFLRLRGMPTRAGWMLAGLVAVLWALPTYVLTISGDIVGQNVQPRYLLPLFVMIAGLALLPWRRDSWRPGRAQAIVMGAAIGGASMVALFFNLRRYVAGDLGGGNIDLDRAAEWWWDGLAISPLGVWAIGTLAFAAAAVLILMEWRRAWPGESSRAIQSGKVSSTTT